MQYDNNVADSCPDTYRYDNINMMFFNVGL